MSTCKKCGSNLFSWETDGICKPCQYKPFEYKEGLDGVDVADVLTGRCADAAYEWACAYSAISLETYASASAYEALCFSEES